MRKLLIVLAATTAFATMTVPAWAATDLNCDDFPSQAAAQAALQANPSDPNNLDADDDGVACESQQYPPGTPRDEQPIRPQPTTTAAPSMSQPQTTEPQTTEPQTTVPPTTAAAPGELPFTGPSPRLLAFGALLLIVGGTVVLIEWQSRRA